MKKFLKLLGFLALALLAAATGQASGVLFAAATELPDAGKQADLTGTSASDASLRENATGANMETADSRGIGSRTAGLEASEELYEKAIDEKVVKIRPMDTPFVQISRYAKNITVDSPEVEYFSVGTRPINTTVASQTSAQTAGATPGVAITFTDNSMFDIDDTIRVVGVQGYDQDAANAQDPLRLLQLHVIGIDSSGHPICDAVNGIKLAAGDYRGIPQLNAGTKVVRMGKACAELDAQTASFANYPNPEIQYCQNFMCQVEQSTFDKISAKKVAWTFSDMEEDGVFDYKVGQEGTFLFGVKGKHRHVVKRSDIYFTGGVWYMAGKDITAGVYDKEKGCIVVRDDEFVDITKSLFTGIDSGNKRKVAIAGKNVIAAFSKTVSDKYVLKEPQEFWEMKFKGFVSEFGELDFIHSEIFNLNGMGDQALIIDPDLLTKATFYPLGRNVIDFDKLGVRKSQAVVLQEICCVYLRSARSHARFKLNEVVDSLNYVFTTGSASFAKTAGRAIVEVESTRDWEASKETATDTWFTLSEVNGKLYIDVAANDAASAPSRTSTVILTSGTVTKEIDITQAANA